MSKDLTAKLKQFKIIPVIQIDNASQAVPLAKALVENGLPVAEVTFRTKAAAEAIRLMREAYPDSTAWDSNDKHFDKRSTPDNPVWLMVDIMAEQEFTNPVTLPDIKANPNLQDMMLVRRGMRLSIQPVTRQEWDEVVGLGTRG